VDEEANALNDKIDNDEKALSKRLPNFQEGLTFELPALTELYEKRAPKGERLKSEEKAARAEVKNLENELEKRINKTIGIVGYEL
jgi:hypothetical protein